MGLNEHEDYLRAELVRVDHLALTALRLGFHDDVRNWREVRTEILRKLRELKKDGAA